MDRRKETVVFTDVPDMPGFRTVRAVMVRADIMRHVHGVLVLGIVDAGDRLTVLRRETVLTPRGALFVVAPGLSHACRPLGAGQSYRALCVDPDRAAAMTGHDAPLAFDRVTVFDRDAASALEAFLALPSAPATLLERQSLAAWLLGALCARYGTLPERPSGHGLETVERVKEYLLSRLAENPSLDEAAAEVHLCPCHLQRLFVEAAGVSPLEFLLRERVRLAADMLARGVGAAQAAQECGFYDQSHFTRHFKRIVGSSPGRFAALNAEKRPS